MKGRLRLEEVSDPAVLDAMEAVPREEFVPEDLRKAAYDDRALPIMCGQTISQPAVVAYMTEQLRLTAESRVLEIGTGSGYQTAVLAEIAREVYSIERIPELARTATDRLARLGYANVRVREGDGGGGWPEAAPFDAIIVTAAAAVIPPALLAQLGGGGRMIVPVGGPNDAQVLVRLERKPGEEITREYLWPVRFVPLICG
jgi:protein-L-isoaspartate(D-aspartate) O-methyltransferase